MELVPIKETPKENEDFLNIPECRDVVQVCIEFYKKVGFTPPWICYYAALNGELVGSAGFKGKPANGTIEIAYGTHEKYRNQGIGTEICKHLVNLALKTDPSVKITARTFSGENFSTRILKKNNFIFAGIVNDPEDGDVWEWVFQKDKEVST